MSRRKKNRTDGGFVMVSRQMTRSAAYQSLSPRAGWLLHGLMDRYQGDDNRVPMSRDEAVGWLKSGTHQAADAFAELEHKGFIRCHERGGFNRKVEHATTWTLTMFGRGGQKATLDFLSWQPEGDPAKFRTRVPTQHRHGCQRSTRDTPTGADAAPANPIHGCQRSTSAGANAAQLIDIPSESAPPHAPIGNRESRAAWLRSHLAAGTLTRAAVASALGVRRIEVEAIASGRTGLSNPSWEKVAALVDWTRAHDKLDQHGRAPKGTQRAKAAWLRDHLEAGVITPAAVASALAIRPDEVEPIAAGKIGLANTSWHKLAALVATKMN